MTPASPDSRVTTSAVQSVSLPSSSYRPFRIPGRAYGYCPTHSTPFSLTASNYVQLHLPIHLQPSNCDFFPLHLSLAPTDKAGIQPVSDRAFARLITKGDRKHLQISACLYRFPTTPSGALPIPFSLIHAAMQGSGLPTKHASHQSQTFLILLSYLQGDPESPDLGLRNRRTDTGDWGRNVKISLLVTRYHPPSTIHHLACGCAWCRVIINFNPG